MRYPFSSPIDDPLAGIAHIFEVGLEARVLPREHAEGSWRAVRLGGCWGCCCWVCGGRTGGSWCPWMRPAGKGSGHGRQQQLASAAAQRQLASPNGGQIRVHHISNSMYAAFQASTPQKWNWHRVGTPSKGGWESLPPHIIFFQPRRQPARVFANESRGACRLGDACAGPESATFAT